MSTQAELIAKRAQKMMSESARRASEVHATFVHTQALGLEQIAGMIEAQMQAVQAGEEPVVAHTRVQRTGPVLFDLGHLVEFATGSMARCFGAEFQVFEGRRHPRIPNGDLLLMSRVVSIDGTRLEFDHPSSILSEYDVPEQAWFWTLEDEALPPFSVLMEIALQPCGFLAAYLGSSLLFPQVDYFFRNLDGNGCVLQPLDVRGKTIVCEAKLLSTVTSGNTIIQKFTFMLSCEGTAFFGGESVFGFFPPEGMASQAGLDGGKTVLPAAESSQGKWIDLARGQMNFLDRVSICEQDASILGVRKNTADAWFYACHFYQDAVMPGSLGVEAILEALRAYARQTGLVQQFVRPVFGLAEGVRMNWRYRGQILPTHEQMKIEVKVTQVTRNPADGSVVLEADASLWADSVRIYEVKRAAICVREGSKEG
jgi:3-hydroxymyristoyl/3-hydroxydecanoyl-(acyl carrier protein) dehydratase